ncbi:hypothetical protein CIL05_06240 [Virgibacillus profundi]|uniref:Uncharacterized protein n=1 Tax=Virgibacillus profundi TaxID=2024555 RepID=A0A2A2IGB5_9BACI|nr:hypothetical protein [Virgibacillus profundi]PAV30697.1 hypothetical protein CIL05_06240 [Virgibacillus profundi]PXY54869.1 hypothetical protein CIT14_06325 [Virgibacillus profundi]
MIREAPVWKAYWFIRKNRRRKKRKINKIALGLMVDKTTGAYLLLLGAYLFASLFIFGDFIQEFNPYFILIEENLKKGFWLILTALPIRYIMKSFREPGLKFSSSEYQLGMLPYSRSRIWLFALIEKWLRQFVIYSIIAGLVILLTPISHSLVISYVLLLMVYDIMMSVPQWRLFQIRFLPKLGWLLLVIFINMFGVLTTSPIVGIVLFAIIIVLNFVLLRSLFTRVNWSRVTEISDYHIWNMWLIGKASQTKFKKQKKYSVFQNSMKRKKAFHSDKALHNRMWKLYLAKNNELLFQLIGALFLMLVVLPFINETLFYIGLAFGIYAYASATVSFFSDRFSSDILHVLPWDLTKYNKSFFKWVLYGAILPLIPIIIFLGIHMTFWVPLQLLFYSSTFLYIYDVKVDKAMVMLAKKPVNFQVDESIGFVLLILIVFSDAYPIISVGFIVILFLLMKRRNKPVL